MSAVEDILVLTGQTEGHLCSRPDTERLEARVHAQVVAPFVRLRAEAAEVGFDLRIVSGFRSFERQRSIWNRKATGELAILDSGGEPLAIEDMSEHEVAYAILRWSALPGASRHHWGTDIDVYDENARPPKYEIELIPSEVENGGMFVPLHLWIDERIESSTSQGFFRPYDADHQGVAPERWHLSYAPLAVVYEEALSLDVLRATISASAIELKSTILENIDDIYRRFVINTSSRSK